MSNFFSSVKIRSILACTLLVCLSFFGTTTANAEDANVEQSVETSGNFLVPSLTQPLSAKDQAALDKILDDAIKHFDFHIEPGDNVSKNVNKLTFLRIKAFSMLFSAQQSELLGSDSALEGTTFLQIYKNLVFLVKPFDKRFEIYPNIDARTVKFVNEPGAYGSLMLLQDKKNLYTLRNGFVYSQLTGVDAATFKRHESLLGSYYKDRKSVYYIYDGSLYRLNGADGATFRSIDGMHAFFKDKRSVYWYDTATSQFKQVKGADPQTFRLVSLQNGEYARDKQSAYYINDQHEIQKIKNLDLTKIKILFATVYQVKNKLYYFNPTFPEPILVGSEPGPLSPLDRGMNLFVGKKAVYYFNKEQLTLSVLPDVSVPSVTFLGKAGGALLLKDARYVYLVKADGRMQVLNDIDVNTFSILTNDYDFIVAKDANAVYGGKDDLVKVAGADVATFHLVSLDGLVTYGQDKNRIYYVGRRNSSVQSLDADPATFAIKKVGFWYYYATDKNNVWFYDNNDDTIKQIPGANPATFNFEAHAHSYFESSN